jgi:anti-sigma regulatory factor (Ser/Thr protein kinase)
MAEPYLDIPIGDDSSVGEARRAAVRLAGELGFDEVASGRVAIVATELGTNLARHARRGRILLGCHDAAGARSLEILALDHGPGMADVNSCLVDGFSTSGTPGTGFGAVQRMADEFSVYSRPGAGTVIAARVALPDPAARQDAPSPARRFRHAGIRLAAPGETACGDDWALRVEGSRAAVMVADGLGHGPHAAEASAAAVESFQASQGRPSEVLRAAHEALRGTRGAAVTLVELDADADTITFAGAGNISVRVISGVEDRTLLSQHGTAGLQIRQTRDISAPWPAHALLVLHSDGLQTRWSLGGTDGLLQCDPSVIAGWLIRDHTRGRDDVTVVVVRRE